MVLKGGGKKIALWLPSSVAGEDEERGKGKGVESGGGGDKCELCLLEAQGKRWIAERKESVSTVVGVFAGGR